ncbi:3-deoxy-manno-octulosonate cytidylyltransferase [Reinekea thalattae]|uniref:3-deoxy-manno-octulosonate cytidylyltransferase n=1 Tax=Reinekea thalattae TaxID=2593301 RepID=A0A5C8Z880_9GAMM|nr:3-deoxy-manno-octulosonate cytidylyltransferase [Reinekea thalattae]TXR53529.1 3-deoxy-manno-octulosonate cytidylyltransferase [Reinekea thalattae]
MKKVVIIPARYNSTRLPGKPLQDIAGKPMVVRVCEAVDASQFTEVVVATDDERITQAVEAAGYRVVMTQADHLSGTDRLQEAASKLGLLDDDIVINLQGDEPLMPSENLQQVASLLEQSPDASVATLYEEVSVEEADNPNIVKLVQGQDNRVLYFSRASIPFDRDNTRQQTDSLKRHVGVYAYRKKALDQFTNYAEGQLEALEKLEQLRFMENGHFINADKAQRPIPVGVDTPEDLATVRALFEEQS